MQKNSANEILPSSFRDPSGFVFVQDGVLFRQINACYRENYDHLMRSGLYDALVGAGLLVPHEELDKESLPSPEAYRIIQPEPIPFLSYPYEWSFSQLKDAALATLEIQKQALGFGMTLKDASAYNIQFRQSKAVFIDTLSFEQYREGDPWVAYRQFCQHFLAPLTLMRYADVRLNQLLRVYIDGIPLDLASRLLPRRTRLNFSLLSHIHLHAAAQQHFVNKEARPRVRQKMSRTALLGLIDNLEGIVRKLAWQPRGTEWADYYNNTNYSSDSLTRKQQLVAEFLDSIAPAPRLVWDLGANNGMFSRVAAARGAQTISWDIDPASVELNYLDCRAKGDINILPLLLDLTNPSPGLGWAHQERQSFLERGPADVAFALALIHHLAIANNVPLERVAHFFRQSCSWLVIEFVPKSDTQVQKLIASREDIFGDYSQQAFEAAFRRYFTIERSAAIAGTERTLYLMRKAGDA